MGTRIVRGRGIEAADVSGAPRVAVVGESMAAALWPGQDADRPLLPRGLKPDSMPCTYVVGVAEDIHSQSIEAEPRTVLLLPAGGAVAAARTVDSSCAREAAMRARLVEPVRRRLQREMPGTSYVTVTLARRHRRRDDALVDRRRDGVHGVRRARARARGGRSVQRDRVQRDAANARTGGASRARRRANVHRAPRRDWRACGSRSPES